MKNLKRLRGLAGITQRELGKFTGIPRTRIVYFESDDCHSLSPAIEEKLCDFFKVNKYELYGIDILRYLPNSKADLQYIIDILGMEMKLWD